MVSGSIKKLFSVDCVSIYLFSIFGYFSIDLDRWKNVGLPQIAYIIDSLTSIFCMKFQGYLKKSKLNTKRCQIDATFEGYITCTKKVTYIIKYTKLWNMRPNARKTTWRSSLLPLLPCGKGSKYHTFCLNQWEATWNSSPMEVVQLIFAIIHIEPLIEILFVKKQEVSLQRL